MVRSTRFGWTGILAAALLGGTLAGACGSSTPMDQNLGTDLGADFKAPVTDASADVADAAAPSGAAGTDGAAGTGGTAGTGGQGGAAGQAGQGGSVGSGGAGDAAGSGGSGS